MHSRFVLLYYNVFFAFSFFSPFFPFLFGIMGSQPRSPGRVGSGRVESGGFGQSWGSTIWAWPWEGRSLVGRPTRFMVPATYPKWGPLSVDDNAQGEEGISMFWRHFFSFLSVHVCMITGASPMHMLHK